MKCSNGTSTTNFRRKRAHSPAVLGWARRRFPVKSRGLIMSLKLLELLRQGFTIFGLDREDETYSIEFAFIVLNPEQ